MERPCKGAFVGITPAHGAGDFVRAVMDGVALNFAINYKEIMKNNPKDDIILYGGCAKSKIWRQIFSDILNTPVYVSEISEEAATYGAMLLASAAVGVDRISDYKVNCKLAAVPSAQAHRRYSEAAIIFKMRMLLCVKPLNVSLLLSIKNQTGRRSYG